MTELSAWATAAGHSDDAGNVVLRETGGAPDPADLSSRWARCFQGGDLHLAEGLAKRLLGQATRQADPRLTAVAQRAVGSVALLQGRISAAETAFARSLTAPGPPPGPASSDEAPQVFSACYRGWTRTIRGAVDQGLDQAERGVAAAQAGGEPATILFAQAMRAAVRLWRGESDLLLGATGPRSARLSNPPWAALALACEGLALTRRGRQEEGLAALRHSLDAWRESGTELLAPLFLALTMEAQLASGQIRAALETSAAALTACDRGGENLMRAEILRLHGLAIARSGDGGGAVHCLVGAITAASANGAGLFELRAMIDLAEVLRGQGQSALAAGGIARCLTQVESRSTAPAIAAARALFAALYREAMP